MVPITKKNKDKVSAYSLPISHKLYSHDGNLIKFLEIIFTPIQIYMHMDPNIRENFKDKMYLLTIKLLSIQCAIKICFMEMY